MWPEDGPELCVACPADPSPRAVAGPEATEDEGAPDEADAGAETGTTGRSVGRCWLCCGRLALKPVGAALGIPGAFMAGDFGSP